MTDFSVYITHIESSYYQIFIKNNASEADFVRIILGYTEIVGGKRTGQVISSWIISPLKSTDEPVFIHNARKSALYGKRPWIAFEAVKRNKPKNKTLGSYIALAPVASKWRKTIGSTTYFDIKAIDSVRNLESSLNENSPSLARMSGTISLS
jgi:hypothetical protein